MLDSFRYQIIQEEAQDEVGDHSFALSRFNPAKRFCFATRIGKMASEGDEINELQKMLGSLESIIADMKEFVVFLSCYPPMHRQPYCKYLLLENCMFGRQSEQERVINFLLQEDLPGAEILPVLPIIGPTRVGKSTLVEHVCHDERVRRYFSLIVLYSGDGIDGGSMVPLREWYNKISKSWFKGKVTIYYRTSWGCGIGNMEKNIVQFERGSHGTCE